LGKTAPYKFIPPIVWEWSNRSIAALLAGIFTTDGTFSVSNQTGRPVVKFGMTAQRVIETARDLFAVRFGLHTSPISKTNIERSNAGALRRSVSKKVPNKTPILACHPMHVFTISSRDHLHRLATIVQGVPGVRVDGFLASVATMDESPDNLSYGYSVVSRELLGPLPTYDIEVDHPDHLFLLANGAVVSNSKRMNNVAHRLVVTAADSKEPHDPDHLRGLPTTLDDPDNEGALLATPVAGYPRNTVLSREVIGRLRRQGVTDVVVRSPMVGGPANGGVYGNDVGVRERGRVAPIGDYVGLAAAQAISGPMTQSIICLAEGTLVRMADWSVRRVETINPGELVLGADMARRTFPVRVLNRFDNGLQPCVRTSFQTGKRAGTLDLESTTAHKILSMTLMASCKEAALNGVSRQLPVGKVGKRFFALPALAFDETDSGFKHEPRAFLLGILLGDGCYTESLHCDPHLSCADELLIAELETYLAHFNLRFHRMSAGGELMYRLSQIVQAPGARDPVTGQWLSEYRNPAKLLLDEFGLLGKYAWEKTIPESAFQWDTASIVALLSGLFVTDGSVYRSKQSNYPFYSFGSTSYRMVEQLKELLAWRFGIYTNEIKANNTSRKRTLYSVQVAKLSDVRRLRAMMTIFGVKRLTYDRLLVDADAAVARLGPRWRARVDAEFRYRRRKQVDIGLRPTHDLEVDHPDHLFVLANGLIVSNSSKHGGGVAGSSKAQTVGFPVLDRMISIPTSSPSGPTKLNKSPLTKSSTQCLGS
jgi:hypothetical protein